MHMTKTPEPVITAEPTPAPAATPKTAGEPKYIWRLINTDIIPGEDQHGQVHHSAYDAIELIHSCRMWGEVDIPVHKTVTSGFSASCSSPPEIVTPEDEVVMNLLMTMESDNDTYHYTGQAFLYFGRPESEHQDWGSAAEGGSLRCIMEAIGDGGNPPARIPKTSVKGLFPDSVHDGHQRVLTFDACGSKTCRTYELQRVN